jgi:hypothetical protein
MRSSASVLAVGNPGNLLRSCVLRSVTNLPGDTTGRHGSRRRLRASLEDRHLVPPPRLRGRTSPRAPRRSRTSADGARRSRLASSVGPAVRHPRDTPPQGIREISRVRSASMAFLPGSRAPPVHLLGFVARTTRHAVCLRDPERARAEREQRRAEREQRRAEQSSAAQTGSRGEQSRPRKGSGAWSGGGRSCRRRRWTSRRTRGGGPTARDPEEVVVVAVTYAELARGLVAGPASWRPRSPRPHATTLYRGVRAHHGPTRRGSGQSAFTTARRSGANCPSAGRARGEAWPRIRRGRPCAGPGPAPSSGRGRPRARARARCRAGGRRRCTAGRRGSPRGSGRRPRRPSGPGPGTRP